MIHFLSSSSTIRNRVLKRLPLFHLHFDFVGSPNHSSIRSLSSTVLDENPDSPSFSVSYLVKSCGLSAENAISVSKSNKLAFKDPQTPDSVLSFLRDHGFTDAHITKFVTRSPQLLSSNLDKILKPKFEFFYSKGVSRSHLATILVSNPTLLHRSLENHLIPSYEFLKNVGQLDDHRIVMALRHWQWGTRSKTGNPMEDNLGPNLGLLRELGVPQSSISLLLSCYMTTACCECTKFESLVRKVSEMGFSLQQTLFVAALHVVSKVNESRWESKIEIYGRYGWSGEDVMLAFRKMPWIMLVSEKKIVKVLDFLIHEMGWSMEDVSRCPSILPQSLEKRVRPRCYVVDVLLSKGLIENVKLSPILLPSEEDFLRKFVSKFEDDVPDLLSVYQAKMNMKK